MQQKSSHIGRPIPSELRNEIRSTRRRLGIKQLDIPTITGGSVQQWNVSRIERGQLKTVTSEVCILCTALHINLEKHLFPSHQEIHEAAIRALEEILQKDDLALSKITLLLLQDLASPTIEHR